MDDQTAANDILTDINDIANIQIEKPNKVRADSSFKHRLVTNLWLIRSNPREKKPAIFFEMFELNKRYRPLTLTKTGF